MLRLWIAGRRSSFQSTGIYSTFSSLNYLANAVKLLKTLFPMHNMPSAFGIVYEEAKCHAEGPLVVCNIE